MESKELGRKRKLLALEVQDIWLRKRAEVVPSNGVCGLDFKRFGEDGRNNVVNQTLNLHSHMDGESLCSCVRVEVHEGQSCSWEFYRSASAVTVGGPL